MEVYEISNSLKDVDYEWTIGRNYYWIICNANEIDELSKKIKLDEESIEECLNLKQSAKINFFDTYLFIVFNILEYLEDDIISKELNIYLGKDFIITIYKENSDIINELVKDIKDSKNCFILKDIPRPCILLYYILDRIIVRNYNIISDLEAKADKIEISILRRPRESHAKELITLRRQVYKIRKFMNPLRYIGDSLVINDNSIIEKENVKYFESLNIKMGKMMQAQENLVQDLALVREAFESEIANKTNELTKVFTLIAAIFLPLNLITGIFGMSIDFIPFKHNLFGCYIILSIMLIIVVFLLFIFKKNKWL
jgi:magnesium transporter